MLRVACDEEAVVALKFLAQRGEAVFDRFARVVFVVDALGARGRGEVRVRSLVGLVAAWAW